MGLDVFVAELGFTFGTVSECLVSIEAMCIIDFLISVRYVSDTGVIPCECFVITKCYSGARLAK